MAINVCQGSGTRADQVALVFGKLYKHYSDVVAVAPYGESPVRAILDSLDTRWGKMDHILFITAILLNPFIKRKLFTQRLSSLTLVSMIEKIYCRVFKLPAVPGELGLSKWALEYISGMPNGDAFGYLAGDWTELKLKQMIPVCIATILSRALPSCMFANILS